jgi:hypothetical protein
MSVMCFQEGSINKIGQATHKRVMQIIEMSAIAHFLSEDVSWICLACNMLNRYSLVLNLFANGVFAQFNVPSRFGGHAV